MKAFKMVIDCIMIIIFSILLSLMNTGLLWHEIVGMVLLAIVVVHLAINRKQTAVLLKAFFKSTVKAKVLFIVDIALSACFILTIASGILVSKELFPALGYATPAVLVSFHTTIPYITMIVTGVHLGLHIPIFSAVFKKMLGQKKPGVLRQRVLSLVGLAMFIISFKLTLDADIASKIQSAASKNSPDQNQGLEGQVLSLSTINYEHNTDYITIASSDSTVPTLEEFLGSLHCTACPKRCSLLAPQCSRGTKQAQTAQMNYESQYSDVLQQGNSASDDTPSGAGAETALPDTLPKGEDGEPENESSASAAPKEDAIPSDAPRTQQTNPEQRQTRTLPAIVDSSQDDEDGQGGTIAKNIAQGMGIVVFFAGATHYLMKLIVPGKQKKRAQ